MSNHGQLTEDRAGRHCDKHGEHGFLYDCPEYPFNVRNEINFLASKFRQQCKDGTIQIQFNGVTQTWSDYINSN